MVDADANLVTFHHGPLSGRLSAHADADADAQFDLRRGLRLSAEARATLQAHLDATLGDDPQHRSVVAAVDASLGTSARFALAAQLGVNGLWAEACAAAEARAQIRGDVTVTGQMLLDAISNDVQLPAGAFVPARAFLREVQIHAGAYAEAYFAVRGRARAMVVGSVIPPGPLEQDAAFTVKFDYGYAYIWGAGVSGFVDVDLPDVPRVLGVVVESVLDEALRLLPPDTPARVVSVLRLAVPLAAAAAVSVGKALGGPRPGEQPAGPDPQPVTDPFLTALQSAGLNLIGGLAMDAAVEAAAAAFDAALGTVTPGDAFRTLASDAVADARALLTELEQAQSLADGLPIVVRLLGPLVALADAPEAAAISSFADALTLACAAAGVLEQVLGRDPMADFPAAPAGRIRQQLALAAGAQLTVVHLVEYLGVEIGVVAPGSLDSLGWLADALGVGAPALVSLLWGLAADPPDPAARRQLAAQALSEVVAQVTTHLRPFLERLPDGELRALAVFVQPLMEVLDVALRPVLTGSQDPGQQEAARLRDELDALLTGVFGAIVVRCLDKVIRPFFGRGQIQLTELADRVDRRDPVFAEFFQLASRFDVVFRMTPAIVSGSLREVAGMLPLAETSAFDSAVELMTVFVLLPADGAERRQQLAVLAGTDEPTVGEARLREELLDALLVKSTEFALGMIAPSVRMSTLIALEQGPVPLVTLYEDARAVGRSAVAAIDHAAGAVSTVGSIVDGLVERGKVRAEDLRHLGDQLRGLISDLSDLVDAIVNLVKEFAWPLFVTSTGGLGLALRAQFDDFFNGAHWLVAEIRARLDRLVDALIEAVIAVAQDVGVLDTGHGEDLGTFGQAVRQRLVGAQGQTGLDLLDGAVPISHAELATMVVNSTFDRAAVRDRVRDFHDRAVEQQQAARETTLLLQPNLDDAKQLEAALQAALTAQQRDTGFGFSVSWTDLVEGSTVVSSSLLEVAIIGAGLEFVLGQHPLVRIEIGGWPVAIDPAGWWVDGQGTLRGQFTVIADAWLGAPHPFVGEGVVDIPPQAAAQRATNGGVASPELLAVHAVAQQQAAALSADPAAFLTRPADHDVPSVAATASAEQFLPPALRDGTLQQHRFPAVLALDRSAMLAATTNARVVGTLAALPGTSGLAFVSATDLASVLDGTGTTSLRVRAPVTSPGTGARPPISVVARARPGYVAVTATVCAVPKADQDRQTTPGGAAAPTWFILADRVEPDAPPAHDDAAFLSQDGVPDAMRPGSTAQVRITVQNTGNTAWTTADGYRLGAQSPAGNTTWGSAWQELPNPVAPGEQVTFTFTIQAPPPSGATFTWQMVRERADSATREWFGPPTPPRQIGLSINNAVFVGQTVPTAIPRLTTAAVSVTMRNIGTTTWAPGAAHRLGALGDDFGAARHELAGPVPPGQIATFTFTIPPPPAPARFQWQMLQEGVEWFGMASDAVQVSGTEPLECADLRAEIAQLEKEIDDDQTELDDAAPGEKAGIARRINAAKEELRKVRVRSTTLGCQP